MGPTWLVLLVIGQSAIVLYRGDDEFVARRVYDAENKVPRAIGRSIVLAPIRAEAEAQ